MRLLNELVELRSKRMLAVVYGGRFQPFHKGHYAVYKQLCKWFGVNHVWIATSNKTNIDPKEGAISPLTFDERKEVMIRMFGIDPDRIVQCKNPAFAPVEVLNKYNGPVVCVLAVGEKDKLRYEGSEAYKPYPLSHEHPKEFDAVAAELDNANEKPFMYYLPVEMKHGISGTEARKQLTKLKPDATLAERKAMMKQIFGGYDELVCQMLLGKLKQAKVKA